MFRDVSLSSGKGEGATAEAAEAPCNIGGGEPCSNLLEGSREGAKGCKSDGLFAPFETEMTEV
ncbi:MAG: hypothetical protein ACEY26_01130 [Candidatus Hodgkinia cicadicola]